MRLAVHLNIFFGPLLAVVVITATEAKAVELRG